MFTNLIESNSHKREFKRRSSFFFATVAAYALVLTAAGIVGVLTYDAQVEAQTTDLALLDWIPAVKPVPHEPEGPRPKPVQKHVASNAAVDPNVRVPERTQAVAPPTDPAKIPDEIGTKGSDVPPVVGPVAITNRNVDPPSATGDSPGNCKTCAPVAPQVVEPKPEPPTVPKPTTQTVATRILVSRATSLPQPPYPQIAKQAGIQGSVNVQILVDESGKVISAHAISGSAMLTHAAEDAAKRARFTPTILNDQAVKVQGVIIYNFILH